MTLKFTTVPNPKLREISQPLSVKPLSTKHVQFLKDMADTLLHKEDPPGVGLSAIQVGQPLRIFMTYLPPIHDLSTMDGHMPASELKIFINPEIIDKSEKMTLGPDKKHPALEGCLSIPNLYGPILRHQTLKIKYQTFTDDSCRQMFLATQISEGTRVEPKISAERNLDLVEKTETFSNFYARVIQHEYDHLDAILFTDLARRSNGAGGQLPLYFDNGQTLIEIPKPEELVKW